jgi:RIO kinase 2
MYVFEFQALHDIGYPVPKPADFNRHCVVMELVNGTPL